MTLHICWEYGVFLRETIAIENRMFEDIQNVFHVFLTSYEFYLGKHGDWSYKIIFVCMMIVVSVPKANIVYSQQCLKSHFNFS
jgi:hypothetical protein